MYRVAPYGRLAESQVISADPRSLIYIACSFSLMEVDANWDSSTPANRALCFLWIAFFAGKQYLFNGLCLAAGCLGSYMCWWSIELDHRLGGDYPIIWQNLGDLGDLLRAIPHHYGLPVHPSPDC